MQTKYIIAGILGLAGLVFGAYNWYNYFKPAGAAPAITAVRPPPRQPDISSPAVPAPVVVEDSKSEPEEEKESRQKVHWPDTLGRNPFLSPGEIELIARGEWMPEEPAQAARPQNQMVIMPGYNLTGLIRDRASGNYRALIGGKAYNIGDSIGMEKIVGITSSAVILAYQDQRRTIRRGESVGKKSAPGVTLKKAP